MYIMKSQWTLVSLPPLINPLVLMADIDNAVVPVTTVVDRISRTPSTDSNKININLLVIYVTALMTDNKIIN